MARKTTKKKTVTTREPTPGSARIGKQGRIVIPANVRHAAGLKIGDRLAIVTVEEGLVTLRTVERAWEDAGKKLSELEKRKP